MIASAIVTGVELSADNQGEATIAFRFNAPEAARHAMAALRTQLRETGRLTIDFGMPVPVTGNDAVVNRS